jgi:hypothetical protein
MIWIVCGALFFGACIGALAVGIVRQERERWEPWVEWTDMSDARRD